MADKEFIQKSFDSITPYYDAINNILSFGMSDGWRAKSSKIILKTFDVEPKAILDLGCGTGKFLECFIKSKTWEISVGLDFSKKMLEAARERISQNTIWLKGDFEALPFVDGSFDLVVSAFTLRSVQSFSVFLKNIKRVLKHNGKVAFLELTRPTNFFAKIFFYPYLWIFLPLIGGIVSGDWKAYRFLSESVRDFKTPNEIVAEMEKEGFEFTLMKRFCFGAATLIITNISKK